MDDRRDQQHPTPQAIDAHIEERRGDSEFQERLTRYMDEEGPVLERLAGGPEDADTGR